MTETMITAFTWDQGLIIKDSMGKRHIFTPYETAKIRQAVYRYEQVKGKQEKSYLWKWE